MSKHGHRTIAALLLLAGACSTPLTGAGAGVRVGKSVPHAGCRELGMINGSGGGGGYTSSETKMRNAQNELRNNAAELGGDFAVMDVVGSDIGGMTISGRAYDCSAPPPATPVPVSVVESTPPQQATSSGGEAPPAEPVAPQQAVSSGDEATPPEEAPSERTAEERLQKLTDLKDKGLISEEEYQTRRTAILDSI